MKRSESIKTYNRPAPAEGLPESPELERAILGALILEPDKLPDVAEIVENSAFVGANNGKIYDAMLSMLERGDKIDFYTLSQRPELKDRDMLRYFSELTSAVGSGVNVLDHARQLADTETRRRLCLFGYELAARAVSDPDGVVDWATSEITAIADRSRGRRTLRRCRMSCELPSTIWSDDSRPGKRASASVFLRGYDGLTH